jgi:sigma-B regulation protein RsbU (phosphoserine phosphatase)
MTLPLPTGVASWKMFLSLNERLLDQPDAASQCRLVSEILGELLKCHAELWLARPYFPLPGEPEIETLIHPDAPAPILQAVQKGELVQFRSDKNKSIHGIAHPLITQDSILGVLFLSRSSTQPFSKSEVEYIQGMAAHIALSLQISRQVVLKNWRYDQITLVRTVSAQIANLTDLDEICRRVTALIQETFGYYYVAIFTLENHSQHLHQRAAAALDNAQNNPPLLAPIYGEGIIGHVAQSGTELLVMDISKEVNFRFEEGLAETQSEFALPIKIENRVLGVLDVQSDRIDSFHEIDALVLQSLADNIALAVEGAQLYTDLQTRIEYISAVYEVSRTLNSILDLNQLLDEIVQTLQKRFDYPYVHIFTIHLGHRRVVYQAGSGARSQVLRETDISYSLDDPHGIIPWVARTGLTYNSKNVNEDPLYRPSELPPHDTLSELAIPLSFGGEVIGVLDIQSNLVNAFDENSIALFETLSAGIAVALRNATLYRTEQWRRKTADSFRDVAILLSANIAVSQLLDTILSELEGNLPCDASAIWLMDEGTLYGGAQNLRLAACHGVSTEQLVEVRQKSPEVQTWLNKNLFSEEPTIRTTEDPFGPLGMALGFPQNYSSIAAPLRAGDQPLGLITLVHRTSGRYGSETKAMTTTFASYASVAIQNARLYQEAQEQAWVSTILLQVAETSQSSDNVDDLISDMVHLTPLVAGVKRCAMFLWDETIQTFTLNSWYGLENPPQRTVFSEKEIPALARLRQSKTTIFVQDPQKELNFTAEIVPMEAGAVVILPLLVRGTLLGAFMVQHQMVHYYAGQSMDQQTLAILQGIAHQTSIALENLNLNEARQEEAYVTAVLLQVAQAVVSQNDLDDIVDTVVHLLPILVGIDTCILYVWDTVQQIYKPKMGVAPNRAEEAALAARPYSPGEYSLLDKVIARDSVFFSPLPLDCPSADWHKHSCFQADEQPNRILAPTDGLFGFPISVKGEVFGVLVAKDSAENLSARERRQEIITGIAQQVALAIQNDRLKEEMVGRERLESEIQLARQIQRTFLPEQLPQVQGWQVDSRWQTARQVGGDFYDIFPLEAGLLGLVIADVSDKGMPAALYMTVARTLLRATSQTIKSPAQVLEHVNNLLINDSQNGMFVTVVYAVLRPATGELVYANAGHNRPLMYQSSSDKVVTLPKGGMALAVLEDIPIEDHHLTLEPGDSLILYTDGATESFSPGGEAFGESRLGASFQKAAQQNLPNLLEAIEGTLYRFREGAPPSDDITFLSLSRLKEKPL